MVAAGIFALSGAVMIGLAVAADLHRHSGVALIILGIGVPCVLALQVADMVEPRWSNRLRLPDRSKLPRARARYRDSAS